MTQVRGKITRADGTAIAGGRVRFTLTGANRGFVTADDETIVDPGDATNLDGAGAYLIDLPGNTAINPAGTRWQRELLGPDGRVLARDDLVVPASGGPYWEEDILASPPAAIPMAGPSNEIDVAERTTSPGALVLNGFNLLTIPDLVVTVPDLDQPVWILCQLWMESNTANVNIDSAIAAPGSNTIGQQIAAAPGFVGAAGKETSPIAWARRPAHSPGEWQAAVTGDAGTITLIAGAVHRIAVLAV